jgi:hypothetical protein
MTEVIENRFKKGVVKVAFIKASFDKVKEQLKARIFNSLNKKWREKEIQLSDGLIISEIEEKSDNDFVEVLIWKPESIHFDLTGFFTNMSDGWDVLLGNYSRQFNEDVISIKLSKAKTEYPIYSFEYKKMGETQRLIRSIKEIDKWEFFEKGNVQQFENIDNYKKRRIADRINNEIIIGYLEKNQIDIEDESFWLASKAVKFWTDLRL